MLQILDQKLLIIIEVRIVLQLKTLKTNIDHLGTILYLCKSFFGDPHMKTWFEAANHKFIIAGPFSLSSVSPVPLYYFVKIYCCHWTIVDNHQYYFVQWYQESDATKASIFR